MSIHENYDRLRGWWPAFGEQEAQVHDELSFPVLRRNLVLGGYWRFDSYIQRNFKPGDKVSDLVGWLKSNGFSEPKPVPVFWEDIEKRISGYAVKTLPPFEDLTQVSYSYNNSDSLCGLTKSRAFWIGDDQGRILELKHQAFRCVFDIP